MSWDYYRFFLAVARLGSLKLAATKLKVDQTTVGRNVTTLENEVGARLFERRSDGFVLTSAGQRILQSIEEIEEKMFAVERRLIGRDEKPEGIVKIAMPGALANFWLVPQLGPFFEKFPEVQLEFLTGPSLVNLARREADLAIRFVEPKQSELIVRKMGAVKLQVFGHKKLFLKKEIPQKPKDLHDFSVIGLFSEATSRGESSMIAELAPQQGGKQVKIRSAAWSSVYAGVKGALGIGILPVFMVNKDNSEILPLCRDFQASLRLWLVYHPDLKQAAKVRVFIDYVSNLAKRDFQAP